MSDIKQVVKENVEKVIDLMGFKGECSITESLDDRTESKNLNCNIKVGEDSNFIIGQHGATLQALESVLRTISFKKGAKERLILDINNYRESKKNNIRRLALALADQVARDRKPQVLKPMNAFERRSVHVFLENDNRVSTESVGEGEERKIVIKPKSIMESL